MQLRRGSHECSSILYISIIVVYFIVLERKFVLDYLLLHIHIKKEETLDLRLYTFKIYKINCYSAFVQIQEQRNSYMNVPLIQIMIKL